MPPESSPTPLELELPPLPIPQRDPFWGYLDLALMIGLLTLSFAVILIGLGILLWLDPSLRDDQLRVVMPIQMVFYLLVYASFWILFKFRYDRGVFSSLRWRASNFSLAWAGACGVLLAFGLSALASLVHTPKIETPFDKLAGTPLSMALLAVMAVLLAPVFEEMFFRGFLQPLLSRSLGVPVGIAITALLFGSLHAYEYMKVWQYVAAVTVVGVVLGIVRARSGSIVPGAVMHGCFNAVSVMALALAKYAHIKSLTHD